MLAQSFKSADELKIPERDRQALIAVLGMLDRGVIPAELFTMEVLGKPACGTAGCILGWAAAVGYDKEGMGFPVRRRGLQSLFYSPLACNKKTTREQAAMALRSYLTTGHARWREAMKIGRE